MTHHDMELKPCALSDLAEDTAIPAAVEISHAEACWSLELVSVNNVSIGLRPRARADQDIGKAAERKE